jgi:hypothetical protein
MTLAILGPLLGFLGLLIGAWLARGREIAKFRKDRITEAYTSYIDAVAAGSGPVVMHLLQKMTSGQTLDKEEMAAFAETNARFVTAHSSLVIYGSKEVVERLSEFYDTGGNPATPAGRDAFIDLIKAMRHDSDAEDYETFGVHVDNILVSGPQRRQAAMMKQASITMDVGFFKSGQRTPDSGEAQS